MTRRLAPVKRTELVKRFRALGWKGPRRGARHDFMVRGNRKVHIPNPHGGKEIGVGLLRIILNQADVSRREWLGEGFDTG